MCTSSPGAPACCASRRRPKRDRRQLGLRRRRLRPRGRRADRLLALPRPPREGAPRARIGRVGATSVCLRPPAVRAGLEVPATMNRRRKFIVGGVVIAGALAYMIYAGVTQSAVYFVPPAELRAAPVPGRHKGTPPDLFGEGRGAVLEGSWTADGYFKANLIMAKHSEEYKAPHDKNEAGYRELFKTLRGEGR